MPEHTQVNSHVREAAYPDVPAPALVIDVAAVERQTSRIQEAFCDNLGPVHTWYAVKCNPHPAILQAVHSAGAGFEVASVRELQTVTAVTGTDPARVPFTNPVKSPKQILDAMALGVRSFTVDHAGEVDKIVAARELLGVGDVTVTVRISVDNSYASLALDGKFGIRVSDLGALASYAAHVQVPVTGVAFHVGSQTSNPAAWADAIHLSSQAFDHLRDHGHQPHLVDLGGGFPADYGFDVASVETIAETVRKAWASHRNLHGAARAVEPGRYVAAAAGTYRANVIAVVERGGQRWVHTDIGAYNGPNEAAAYRDSFTFPVVTQPVRGTQRELAIVTGPTCDPADTVTPPVYLPQDLRVGDVVEIGMAGAYSNTLASSFNGFDPPAVYVADDGVVKLAG